MKNIPIFIIIITFIITGLFYAVTEEKESDVEYPLTGLEISTPRCKIEYK